MGYSVSDTLAYLIVSNNGEKRRRKRSCCHFYYDPPNLTVTGIVLASALLLLKCGLVAGTESSYLNSKDWIKSVPFKSIPTRTVQEVEKWAELQGELSPISHPVDSSDEVITSKWYASHKNDPRIGFFYSVDPPNPPSTTPTPSTSTRTMTTTIAPETTSSPYQSLPISAPSNDSNDYFLRQGKKKRRKKKVKKENSHSKSLMNSLIPSPTPTPSPFTALSEKVGELLKNVFESGPGSARNALTQNADEESGRTFFITPLLAYLFPVFLAQIFGMGMIPAAAIITLPIFLLPLGIAAAVFLI